MGAGMRRSKSQFHAGWCEPCTLGVRNTSAPTRTSTYGSTGEVFCPDAVYLHIEPGAPIRQDSAHTAESPEVRRDLFASRDGSSTSSQPDQPQSLA